MLLMVDFFFLVETERSVNWKIYLTVTNEQLFFKVYFEFGLNIHSGLVQDIGWTFFFVWKTALHSLVKHERVTQPYRSDPTTRKSSQLMARQNGAAFLSPNSRKPDTVIHHV